MSLRLVRPLLAVAAFVCLFVSAGCSKEPLTVYSEPPAKPIGDTTFIMNNSVNQELLLQLVNDKRSKGCNCGDTFMAPAAPLTWNKSLERAAYLHTVDMNDNSYFAHENKAGELAGARITDMGYPWQSWGENIALGKLTEKSVVEGWYKSVTHCKVMMSSKFTEMGVAKTGNFWAQAVAAPKLK